MYHLCRIYPDMPLKATSTVGYVGVAFFFVLSGFVLTWSTPIYNGVEAKSCEAFFYLCAPLLISVLNALKPLQRYLAAAAGAGVAWSIGLAMVCLRTGQVTTVSGILMVPAFAWLIYACAQADLDGRRAAAKAARAPGYYFFCFLSGARISAPKPQTAALAAWFKAG